MPPKKKLVNAASPTPQVKKKIVRPSRKSLRNSNASEIANDTVVKEPQKNQTTIIKKKGRPPSKLNKEIKIALANEVVRAQFQKQNDIRQIAITSKLVAKKPILKRKYQTKKNIIKNGVVPQETADNSNKEDVISPERKKPRIVRKNSSAKIAITVDNSQDNVKPTNNLKPTRRRLSLNRKNMLQGLVRTVVNDYIPESSQNTETLIQEPPNQAQNVEKTEVEKSSKINGDTNKENQESNSRRSSLISSSEFSWTKDISNSSTTTCVTVMSNDFFRIDNKIPFIKLTKISDLKKEESSESSDSSSESDSSSSDKQTDVEICSNALNLSTSSSCNESVANKTVDSRSVYDKMSDVLKTFNPEQCDWTSGSDETQDTDKFKEHLAKENVFEVELMLLSLWLDITNLESEDSNANDVTNEISHNNTCDTESIKPHEICDENSSNMNKPQVSTERILKNRHSVDEEDDVDDALSLFAESILDVESNRRSSVYAHPPEPEPEVDEYVPQPLVPVTFKKPKPVSYNPTKIISELSKKTNQLNICEKQSADSTSLRNNNDCTPIVNNFETSSESSRSDNDEPRKLPTPNFFTPAKPCFMQKPYHPTELVKSTLLRGTCVFNLIENCKNAENCNFPHNYPDAKVIANRMERLADDDFMQEYIMFRSFIQLRRMYGLCFIDACVRRNLTRCLVEMSIDFVLKSNDAVVKDVRLKTEALERTLLYLNYVDLPQCEDLLKWKVRPGVLLCDVFLQVIGQSQNFNRFRTVFIKLTMFMCRIDRTFDSEVAGQVLERVCILPYELGLNRTLLEILKKTDPIVFSNSMCEMLESRLLSTNKMLYDDFIRLKQMKTSEVGQSNVLEQSIRCSPDTTNYDNMNKMQEEFTRATELNMTSHNKFNKRNKRNFRSRWGPMSRGARGNGFVKRPPLKTHLNGFHGPLFPASQNPGHILSNMNKKK
ncbi:uncharacterized protein LOC123700530 isoform X2 [Colias croceus]|uniref:uncharacterized protein LOC123700530 isoform X2 n=1 Tax=Colias crocea TaxID=72248 RepID=UPI001E27E1E1|nr:uncharacterized protein LOC123700530 isoform X2 [Colias croceus]